MSVRMSVVEAKKHISRTYHEMNQLMKSSQLITLAHKRRKDYIKKYGEMMYVALGERLGSTLHAVVGEGRKRQEDVKYPWVFWSKESKRAVDRHCNLQGEELFLALRGTLEMSSWDDVLRTFTQEQLSTHDRTMVDLPRALQYCHDNAFLNQDDFGEVFTTHHEWQEYMHWDRPSIQLLFKWFEALALYPGLKVVDHIVKRMYHVAPWTALSYTPSESTQLYTTPIAGVVCEKSVKLVKEEKYKHTNKATLGVLVGMKDTQFPGLKLIYIGRANDFGQMAINQYAYNTIDGVVKSNHDWNPLINEWYVHYRAIKSGVTGYPVSEFQVEYNHSWWKNYEKSFRLIVADGQEICPLNRMLLPNDFPMNSEFQKAMRDVAIKYVQWRNVPL